MHCFKEEAGVFIGWVHYIVFDALVARWIVLDSIHERQVSTLGHVCMVIPCVFFTLMAGPMGFLMYLLLRNIIPSSGGISDDDVKNKGKRQ